MSLNSIFSVPEQLWEHLHKKFNRIQALFLICILFDSIFIIAATNSNLLVEFAVIVWMELLLEVITPIQKARIIVKVTMLLMAQRNMYRPTVENIVDSNLGQVYFASFLTGLITDATIGILIKKASFFSSYICYFRFTLGH